MLAIGLTAAAADALRYIALSFNKPLRRSRFSYLAKTG